MGNTKLYEQRVQELMLAYAATKRLFDFSNKFQDLRRQQNSSYKGNKNNRASYCKDAGEINILMETVGLSSPT